MEFKEIVAPSIRELFVQQMTGMILSGQLLDEQLPDGGSHDFFEFHNVLFLV